MCITTTQPDILNLVTKQHAVVNNKYATRYCHMSYVSREIHTRHVVAPFTTLRCHCTAANINRISRFSSKKQCRLPNTYNLCVPRLSVGVSCVPWAAWSGRLCWSSQTQAGASQTPRQASSPESPSQPCERRQCHTRSTQEPTPRCSYPDIKQWVCK